MRHERIAAKRKVTQHLKAAERAIDDAGIAIGQLIVAGLEARKSAGLSITVGDQSINGLIETITGWSSMRASVIGTHHHLHELSGQLGFKPQTDGGDLGEKIDGGASEAATDSNVIPLAA